MKPAALTPGGRSCITSRIANPAAAGVRTPMILDATLFLIGLLLLYYGADALVKGASRLARGLGWSPVIIGLTIVAFGTSTPELVISLVSSVKGKSMIAVGNVIGSNICNIALVLGLSAAIRPMVSHPSVRNRDIPIMLGVTVYLLLISFNSIITRAEGITLIVGICLYTLFNYRLAVKGAASSAVVAASPPDAASSSPFTHTRLGQVVFIVGGTLGVILGADLLIESAVSIMKVFGVSEKFIGLTVVAFGTSLPELATSAVAAVRGEADISIGNLVGSNVFNILSVLGFAALVRPIPMVGGFVEGGLVVDYAVMLVISALPWFMMRRDYALSRGSGIFLLSCYAAYLTFLIFKG